MRTRDMGWSCRHSNRITHLLECVFTLDRRDDSNDEVRLVIQDLEKFWVLTEITILPFLEN